MEACWDWSVRVRVSLSSSEWGRRFKTRACASAPTCAPAASDRAGFARWARVVEEAAGGAEASRQATDSWRPPSWRGEGWRAEAGVAAGYREQAGSGVAQGWPGEATPGPPLPLAEPSPTGFRGVCRHHLSPVFLLVALQTPDPPKVRVSKNPQLTDARRTLPPGGGDGVCPKGRAGDCFSLIIHEAHVRVLFNFNSKLPLACRY